MYISGYQPIFMLLTSSLILHKFHCKPLHRTNADETSPQRHADSDGITLKAGKDKLIVLANDDEEFKSYVDDSIKETSKIIREIDSSNSEHQPLAGIRSKRDTEQESSHRQRRSANHELSHRERRSADHDFRDRRSAAWFLSAAIKLCNDHRELCKKIEVEDRDVKVTIRLEDE